MGAKSQRKGRAAERELAELLRQAGFPSVRAGDALFYGRWPDVAGLEGVHVEVKRCERLELAAWMRQAVEDAARFGGLPCVFHRQNRQGWLVSMRLADWLNLYERAIKHE